MKKLLNNKVFKYFALAITCIIAAFCVRYAAMYTIENNLSVSNQVFNLIYVKNTGAAFSLFDGHTDMLIVLSCLVLGAVLSYIFTNAKRISNLKRNALAILTAGIIGNLYERIYDGFVTDYINLSFINFPVFNAFDMLISIGALLLIIALYNNK